METIKVIIFEYILGYCLQGSAIVFGIYAFNRQKIIVKNYILASILIMIISYLVRLLPISFGVHTIINMLFLYLICVIPLKMPAYTTIRSTSIVTVLLLICEMVDVAIIIAIIGKTHFESLMYHSLQRSYIALPGNVLFALVVIVVYHFLTKKGDNHRNISSQVG
ncbi:MAG: hypothetical protein K0S47_2748 [Herbinix sp.]|jgi:hypothetical protein|nr:hypothetical protein [Herbinix sp.]